MIRKAHALWKGSGRDGAGHLTTESGVLNATPYSYRTRFEGDPGTNPEELIAAAHAACFTMSLAFRLQTAGYTPTTLRTDAAVTLVQDNGSFRITRSALTIAAAAPGLVRSTLEELAAEAERTCPVSQLLNAEITLEITDLGAEE
jgi:osmotically inducible protein OsmC